MEHSVEEQGHAHKLAERIAIESYREMILYVGDRDLTTQLAGARDSHGRAANGRSDSLKSIGGTRR
jgi:hypothetical protein